MPLVTQPERFEQEETERTTGNWSDFAILEPPDTGELKLHSAGSVESLPTETNDWDLFAFIRG
jgi:hypothetical protein